MHIENEAAGSVIGKGGQKVGEIRKISGAQVKAKLPWDWRSKIGT